MPDFIAYYRVSTDRQGASGRGLEAQRAAVLRHIATGRLAAEYTEVESGQEAHQPPAATCPPAGVPQAPGDARDRQARPPTSPWIVARRYPSANSGGIWQWGGQFCPS